MNKQELQEIFALLDEARMIYELCDTPVPVSLSGVPCGYPTDLGDRLRIRFGVAAHDGNNVLVTIDGAGMI